MRSIYTCNGCMQYIHVCIVDYIDGRDMQYIFVCTCLYVCMPLCMYVSMYVNKYVFVYVWRDQFLLQDANRGHLNAMMNFSTSQRDVQAIDESVCTVNVFMFVYLNVLYICMLCMFCPPLRNVSVRCFRFTKLLKRSHYCIANMSSFLNLPQTLRYACMHSFILM